MTDGVRRSLGARGGRLLCGAEIFHHGPVTLDRAFSGGHDGSLEVIAAEEPNLSLEAISVSPWRTAVGQPTQVTVVVRNVGGLHSHDSTVTLELPDGPRTQSCPVLAPGSTCSRTFGWTPTLEGTVTLVASVLHHPDSCEFIR